MPDPIDPTFRSRDPLHGITLEMMLHRLVDYYGWPGLADRIPVRCFMFDPTVTSSLKFLGPEEDRGSLPAGGLSLAG